jgi:hypothetical protein
LNCVLNVRVKGSHYHIWIQSLTAIVLHF